MPPLSVVRRRQVILAWTAIAVAWAGLSLAGIMLAAERRPVAVGATTAVALAAGAFVTRRLQREGPRASIKLRDLRPRSHRRR